MKRSARTMRIVTVSIIAAGLLAVTGCGGGNMPGDDALYESAREINLTFKGAVAEVQSQLYDGEWEVVEYGDAPRRCDDGYDFFMRRRAPEGFSFGGDGPRAMKELHRWLSENGWTVDPIEDYGDGIANIVVVAARPGADVGRLDIELLPGDAAGGTVDVLSVRGTSTCQPGDPNELMAELYPGFPASPPDVAAVPAFESPDATPFFGVTADGQPRRE